MNALFTHDAAFVHRGEIMDDSKQMQDYDDFESLVTARIKEEFIDVDKKTGFSAEFLSDALQGADMGTLLLLEDASREYVGPRVYSYKNTAAMRDFGEIVLAWLMEKAREQAIKNIEDERNQKSV